MRSLTSKGETGVFISYTLELRVQKASEVDTFSLGGKCEEPRRDANVELRLVAAKTQLEQRLLCVLRTQTQDVQHASVHVRRTHFKSRGTQLDVLTRDVLLISNIAVNTLLCGGKKASINKCENLLKS